MIEALQDRQPARFAMLKVLYLLSVTAAAFAVPAVQPTRPWQWPILLGLLGLQVVLLLPGRGLRGAILRTSWRLKWLFLFLLVCYTLLPAENSSADEKLFPCPVPGTSWTIPLNLTGLTQAGLMCLQLLTVLLASAVVRRTGSGTDLVDGLRAFGLPKLFVHTLDQTLALLGGLGAGQAPARGKDAPQPGSPPAPGLFHTLGRLLRGDVAFFVRSLQNQLDRARAHVASTIPDADYRLVHDVAVITGVALVMVSLKMVKLLPGVPFAPGIKTVLLFPLYILASRLTWSRWGGTVAGTLMGVIGFLQGDGRFGVLEILKHLAPGLVIDLSAPVVRRLPQSALVFCLLGLVAAIARTSTELAVVLLLGARAEVYLFPAARLIPNLIAGTLSGFVTVWILRAFPPAGPHSPRGVPGAVAHDPGDTANVKEPLVHPPAAVAPSPPPILTADAPDPKRGP